MAFTGLALKMLKMHSLIIYSIAHVYMSIIVQKWQYEGERDFRIKVKGLHYASRKRPLITPLLHYNGVGPIQMYYIFNQNNYFKIWSNRLRTTLKPLNPLLRPSQWNWETVWRRTYTIQHWDTDILCILINISTHSHHSLSLLEYTKCLLLIITI